MATTVAGEELMYPPFRLLGGHDDGSRPVPDVCQCLDAGGA